LGVLVELLRSSLKCILIPLPAPAGKKSSIPWKGTDLILYQKLPSCQCHFPGLTAGHKKAGVNPGLILLILPTLRQLLLQQDDQPARHTPLVPHPPDDNHI
jgi:hypothetical protein